MFCHNNNNNMLLWATWLKSLLAFLACYSTRYVLSSFWSVCTLSAALSLSCTWPCTLQLVLPVRFYSLTSMPTHFNTYAHPQISLFSVLLGFYILVVVAMIAWICFSLSLTSTSLSWIQYVWQRRSKVFTCLSVDTPRPPRGVSTLSGNASFKRDHWWTSTQRWHWGPTHHKPQLHTSSSPGTSLLHYS